MADLTANNDRPARRSHPPFAHPGATLAAPRESERASLENLPSIQHFLDELPSVDDFLEQKSQADLPSIDDYVHDGAAELDHRLMNSASEVVEYDADGWAVTGWQSFNWSGAATLGIRETGGPASGLPRQMGNAGGGGSSRAQGEMPRSARGREAPSPRRHSEGVPPTADEVAGALDRIAERIRSGELVIDRQDVTPPEAAMAAALAALLRMRG